jgi:hypothetical protein
MFGTYFYHEHTKRAVAVFGTLFNNLKVTKRDSTGNILSTIKVPLSYGPRQKFLARIQDEAHLNDPKLAIRLPRMSFEIIAFTYDSDTKLQKGTVRNLPSTSPTSRQTILYPVTYRLNIQLNILSKTQDDGLQILEQILPFFQPEYTVTVKNIDGNFKYDMPFTLESVSMSDDYEGDFVQRRAIITTLEFETRVQYYGPKSALGPIIKKTEASFAGGSSIPLETISIEVSPSSAGENDTYELVTTYTDPIPDRTRITFTGLTNGPFVIGKTIIGTISGTVGYVNAINGNVLTVSNPDGFFQVGETITGSASSVSATIGSLVNEVDPIINIIDSPLYPTKSYD